MSLPVEAVLQMAPDSSSQAAGKKLASPKDWKNLGQNDTAIWGECQGSALYQVKTDKMGQGYKCTCPSHKFPCKHVLGLLIMFAQTPQHIREAKPPAWVEEWLTKRQAAAERKVAQQSGEAKPKDTEASTKAAAKRREERQQKILDGLDQLELWLYDLIRNGLANPQIQEPKFWAERAARLVDAQAPGIAPRLQRMG